MSVSELKLFTFFPIDVLALDVYVSIYIICIMDLVYKPPFDLFRCITQSAIDFSTEESNRSALRYLGATYTGIPK